MEKKAKNLRLENFQKRVEEVQKQYKENKQGLIQKMKENFLTSQPKKSTPVKKNTPNIKNDFLSKERVDEMIKKFNESKK